MCEANRLVHATHTNPILLKLTFRILLHCFFLFVRRGNVSNVFTCQCKCREIDPAPIKGATPSALFPFPPISGQYRVSRIPDTMTTAGCCCRLMVERHLVLMRRARCSIVVPANMESHEHETISWTTNNHNYKYVIIYFTLFSSSRFPYF